MQAGRGSGAWRHPSKGAQACAHKLSSVLHSLFCEDCHHTYNLETATIMPVPRKPWLSEPSHFCPFALMPINNRCFEKRLLNIFCQWSPHSWIPSKLPTRLRGVQRMQWPACYTSTLCISHATLPGSSLYTWVLLLIPFKGTWWSKSYTGSTSPLPNPSHSQLYQWQSSSSAGGHNHITHSNYSNTGVPQGCVLSPVQYTLYTSDCTSPSPTTTYLKYSDDAAILALFTDKNFTVDHEHHNTLH